MPDIIHQATHLVIESNYDEHMLVTGRYPLRLQKRISGPNGHISNAETAVFLANNLNRDLIKKVWLCHLSAENNVPRIAYETCAEKLVEAGYILNGENRNVNLEVLARQTPSLLTDL